MTQFNRLFKQYIVSAEKQSADRFPSRNASFKIIKFPRGSSETNSPDKEAFYCFYCKKQKSMKFINFTLNARNLFANELDK